MAPLRLINDGNGLIVMTVIFDILIIGSVGLRLHARVLTKAGFKTDDWLAFVALFFTLALNSIFIAGIVRGPITGHSNVVGGLPVTNDLEILTQKFKYAYQITEKIVFGLIKLSILFLWKRLFGSAKWFRFICYFMMGVVVAWTIAFFFETVFQCGTNWQLNWAPIFVFLTQCTASLDVLTAFGISDLITDLIIITMPIPLIWSLQMPKPKKIAITGIFTLGFFTMVAGALRLFYYLETSYKKEENPDFIADVTLTLVWSTIEANVAMLVCSLPILSPIFRRFRRTLTNISHRSRTRSNRSGSSKWVDITNEQSNDEGGYQFSNLSAKKGGATVDTISSSLNGDSWADDHRTLTSATYAGTNDLPIQNPGIVAHTEISTTFEPSVPHQTV